MWEAKVERKVAISYFYSIKFSSFNKFATHPLKCPYIKSMDWKAQPYQVNRSVVSAFSREPYLAVPGPPVIFVDIRLHDPRRSLYSVDPTFRAHTGNKQIPAPLPQKAFLVICFWSSKTNHICSNLANAVHIQEYENQTVLFNHQV